jgi:hypothetical protein
MERKPVTQGRNIAAVGYESPGIYFSVYIRPNSNFPYTHLNPKKKEEGNAEATNPQLEKDLRKAVGEAPTKTRKKASA